MKVAIVTVLFPCPSETFVLSQIKGLLDRSVDVHIFAHGKAADFELSDVPDKYNLLKRTTYYETSTDVIPRSKLIRILTALKLFLKSNAATKYSLLKSLNYKIFGKKALSLQSFYTVYSFSNIGLDDFDVVHCQFGTLGQLAAVLKEVGIIKGSIITSFHGYDLSVYLDKVGKNAYAQLFRCGDLFLPISLFWERKLIKLGCPEDRIIVHRMGVDMGQFLFQPRSQKNDEGIIRLISVGRLVEKKGMEFGIRAFAKLYFANKNLRYTIVGDGELFDYLKSLTEILGVSDVVDFLGWKTPNEIVGLMENSNIFLAPCVTAKNGDQEGIPMVIMEAMALGLPVISTYHTGIPELIENEQTGYLVAERDVDALVRSIEILVSNTKKQIKFSKSGRIKVEQEFNSNVLNDRLLSLYQNVINK